MNDAVREFCSDPKNVKEIPACNCLTATDMIDQDVKRIIARHDEIVKHNKSITEENKEKLEELDKYISSYRSTLENKRYTTGCSYNARVDGKEDCMSEGGYDKMYPYKSCDFPKIGMWHGICGYSDQKISNMVLTERHEKARTSKYKPEPL